MLHQVMRGCLLIVAVAALLWTPRPAAAYIDGPYGLGSIVTYSAHIFVVQVEKVSTEKRVVIYKKVADLKGKYPSERFHHQINDGSKVVLEWAEPGKMAICFVAEPNLNHPFLTCIGPYWYLCSPSGTAGWWKGDGMPFLCWAYCGSAEKLREHLTAIMAGKEVVVTAVQHGGEGLERWANYTSLAQARKYPLWRIKASLQKADRPSDKKTDLFVAHGAGGAEDVPRLCEALKSPEKSARLVAIQDLAQIGADAKAAVPALTQLLKDDDGLVRLHAADALCSIQPANPAAFDVLVQSLKSGTATVPTEAAEALGKLGPRGKAAVPALVEALKAPAAPTRRAAAWALLQVGPDAKAAVPALKETLGDKDVMVRRAAATTLLHLDPSVEEAVVVLGQALKDPDWMNRREAIIRLYALGMRAKPAAVDLADAVTDYWAGEGAAALLIKLGDQAKAAVPNLIKVLQDKRYQNPPQPRYHAIRALGAIGPAAKEAIPILTPMARDGKDFPEIVKEAGEALKKIQKQ